MYSNEEVKKRYVGKIIFAPCSFQLKFTKMKYKDITIMKVWTQCNYNASMCSTFKDNIVTIKIDTNEKIVANKIKIW
jgi:hypothetical protein